MSAALHNINERKLAATELTHSHTPAVPRELPTGIYRQYFRLVTSDIGVWYQAHSTPNPNGIQPDAPIITHDKFTGKDDRRN